VLPGIPGKAEVVIGMSRSGKTYCLFQEMRRLVDAGVPRSSILYVNLEDDRLGTVDRGSRPLACAQARLTRQHG